MINKTYLQDAEESVLTSTAAADGQLEFKPTEETQTNFNF